MDLFCLGAFVAVRIHFVDIWVDKLEEVFSWVLDSVFNTLYLKNHFSGFTEIGIDPGLLNVPKSHL